MVSSADSARSCPALTEARRLATWVGEGRRVTPKGFLRPADVAAAAEAMGISVPPFDREEINRRLAGLGAATDAAD